jgi:hypothetical protein
MVARTSGDIWEGAMEDDKTITERMGDLITHTAEATKIATKLAVRKVKKTAKQMMRKEASKKKAANKKPAATKTSKQKKTKKSRR